MNNRSLLISLVVTMYCPLHTAILKKTRQGKLRGKPCKNKSVIDGPTGATDRLIHDTSDRGLEPVGRHRCQLTELQHH